MPLLHDHAKAILRLIQRSGGATPLTYAGVAESLGLGRDSARAMASACDLMDAAAVHAGKPMLALVSIRSADGSINPEAWNKGPYARFRNQIIARSLDYRFTKADLKAIEEGLDQLSPAGSRKAWARVRQEGRLDRWIAVNGIDDRPPPDISLLASKVTREDLLAAVDALKKGVGHKFSDSTGYDVLVDGRRFPPKAVFGLAISKHAGYQLGPYDFKGGHGSACFRTLQNHGLAIVTKGQEAPFPDELDPKSKYVEGASSTVLVNKYERDPDARSDAIKHHGCACLACGFDFEARYGELGAGFIHVHHTVPLSSIGESYEVDPVKDLVPVCPNCHAMLHKRTPPYTLAELKQLLQTATRKR